MLKSHTAPRQPKGQFSSTEDYLNFLTQNRARRGEAWYNEKIAKLKERQTRYQEKKDISYQTWRQNIDAWGASGGFERVLEHFNLGQGKRLTSMRFKYHVGSVPFEVNLRNQSCTRWDGAAFASSKSGKKGFSGALGLAVALCELNGSLDAWRDAAELISSISGIAREDVEVTSEAQERLRKMQAEVAARREAEEAEKLIETDILDVPEKAEEIPSPITNPDQIRNLTELMAAERGFPIEYAERLVKEGLIWFGTYRVRTERNGHSTVIDTKRPVACSDVFGFATGVRVGISSREFNAFMTERTGGKGKNLGDINKGAVIIGDWNESTKRITVVEGVYDAAALRLLRENQGKAMGPDECIMIIAGSRSPERLIAICKERGVSVIGGFDNDMTGWGYGEKFAEECARNEVPYETRTVPNGETEVWFANTEWGRQSYGQLVEQIQTLGVNFTHLPSEDGNLRLAVKSSPALAPALTACRKSHSAELRQSQPTATTDEPVKQMGIDYHRADWNSLIQKHYIPVCRNPSGLPGMRPDAMQEACTLVANKYGFPIEEANDLFASGMVYPALIQGELHAIWPVMDPSNHTPAGYMSDTAIGKMRPAGMPWEGLLHMSGPSNSLTITDSMKTALECEGGAVIYAGGPLNAQMRSLIDQSAQVNIAISDHSLARQIETEASDLCHSNIQHSRRPRVDMETP